MYIGMFLVNGIKYSLKLVGRHSKIVISKRKITKKCIVYHTACDNPLYNLAFEEWMYEKVDLSTTKCMFLWRSQPSVVVGRHQNTWSECNIRGIRENGVHLVRRQSGGGTVYHDQGNLNITFLTNRKSYDRRENLRMILNAMSKWSHLDLDMNCKDDLIMSGNYKVSGSSSKLGRNNAYHHCTLLFDADLEHIKTFLEPSIENISTKATASVRSPTANLSSNSCPINHDMLKDALTQEYFSYHKLIAAKQGNTQEQIVAMIDPRTESMFPGLKDIYLRLMSWDWVFAKSPKFSVERTFDHHKYGIISLRFNIVNGLIEEFSIETTKFANFMSYLEKFVQGTRFAIDDIRKAFSEFRKDSSVLLNESDKEYIGTIVQYCEVLLAKT